MKNRVSSLAGKLLKILTIATAVSLMTIALVATSSAKTHYAKIYQFTGGTDGGNPLANLITDAAGNLYGTTTYGDGGYACSNYGTPCGTVFKLAYIHGRWEETVLYTFNGRAGGSLPIGSLIFDKAGNLYGTAAYGGQPNFEGGVVFKLSPTPSGEWKEQVLHTFYHTPGSNNSAHGANPETGLVFDTAGNLFGTVSSGGEYEDGGVFELSPTSTSEWKYKLIYSFTSGVGGNAISTYGNLNMDSAGNLYGTAANYGEAGVVFELSPTSSADWQETVLYAFSGPDGEYPMGQVIFDPAGNLYGTSQAGGPDFGMGCGGVGCGEVYELSPIPGGGGGWTENILFAFPGGTGWQDNAGPSAGLVFDSSGNLYGTTDTFNDGLCSFGPGGDQVEAPGCGSIFELSPIQGGAWTESELHIFGYGKDGNAPAAGLTVGPNGTFYGTTEFGGLYGYGTVFEVIP